LVPKHCVVLPQERYGRRRDCVVVGNTEPRRRRREWTTFRRREMATGARGGLRRT